MITRWLSVGLAALLAFSAWQGGALAAGPAPGFDYAAVTETDVPRMKFAHFFDEQKQFHDAAFAWTFDADGTFRIAAGKKAIAGELCRRLLGEAVEVQEITGRWRLVPGNNGGVLIRFLEVVADGKERQTEDATYRIYRTAPTVVRIGEPQYVFSLQKAAE